MTDLADIKARDVQTLLDDNEALRAALEEARKDFDHGEEGT